MKAPKTVGPRLERVRFFESRILDFFQKAGREHLPWRQEGIGAYEVWVSEVMLQQTQVSRVIQYYTKFLERFPTVETLARASWEEFLPYYAGLGYYSRGRNMLSTAKVIAEKCGGEFPRDVEALQKLPGVGPYTAAAIASFAYGANELAWDTNLCRVIGRFFWGTKNFQFSISHFPARNTFVVGGQIISKSQISKEENVKNRKEKKMLQTANWKLQIEQKLSLPAKVLNAALMDFGSAICLAKPKCAACPLRAKCRYFEEKGKRELRSMSYESRKKHSNVDWRNAKAVVFLHENHKRYFSSRKHSYQPFLLLPAYNTRAGIKEWFRNGYRLEVSVRPPHEKRVIDGKPILFVNAQILSGTHMFREYTREEFRKYAFAQIPNGF